MEEIEVNIGPEGSAELKPGTRITVDVELGGITLSDGNTDTRVDIKQGGSTVRENPQFLDLSSDFTTSSNSNGGVDLGINFPQDMDTHIDVESGGQAVLSDISSLNAGTDLEIVDDGDGSATINSTLTVSNPEKLAFETGHAQWAAGLSNAEIYRIDLNSGETLTLDRVEAQLNGGGTASNLTVEVYDVTAGTVIDSTTAGSVSTSGGSSGSGNVVIVRVSNSTGSQQEANFVVRGEIS